MTVAIVHDYLTQRGGAERVVLSIARAFPDAPVYTSLYEPEATFEEFKSIDVRALPLNRNGLLRRHHRLALPLLASSFSRARVHADVVVCSSSGWAHGVGSRGQKVVYCHTPARWLYQTDQYLGHGHSLKRLVLESLRPALANWDRQAAASARRYVANSTVVQRRIHELYGIEAALLPAPHSIDPTGPHEPVPGLSRRFFLCVTRLLPYKNVDAVLAAFAGLPDERLVVAGAGPDRERLERSAPPNTAVIGTVTDPQLRWLYANCEALVAASYEDYGLTPLEAAAFGKPTVALRWGGFLDTVREDRTGVFFDTPDASAIRDAVRRVGAHRWRPDILTSHSRQFDERRFITRLREIVDEVHPLEVGATS